MLIWRHSPIFAVLRVVLAEEIRCTSRTRGRAAPPRSRWDCDCVTFEAVRSADGL